MRAPFDDHRNHPGSIGAEWWKLEIQLGSTVHRPAPVDGWLDVHATSNVFVAD
jgi:hypothetical protein